MFTIENERQFSKYAMTCFHCGNETILEIIAAYQAEDYEYSNHDAFTEPVPMIVYYTDFHVYICPACKNPTIKKDTYNTVEVYPSGNYAKAEEVIYPLTVDDSKHIPIKIRSAFESAIRTKNIDLAMCSIGLRRTLEFICIDQKASGNNLSERLKFLSDNAVIPKSLDTASHLIRTLGNAAVHDDNANYDTNTLHTLIKFTKIIIEYIYIIPKELEALTQKGNKLQ